MAKFQALLQSQEELAEGQAAVSRQVAEVATDVAAVQSSVGQVRLECGACGYCCAVSPGDADFAWPLPWENIFAPVRPQPMGCIGCTGCDLGCLVAPVPVFVGCCYCVLDAGTGAYTHFHVLLTFVVARALYCAQVHHSLGALQGDVSMAQEGIHRIDFTLNALCAAGALSHHSFESPRLYVVSHMTVYQHSSSGSSSGCRVGDAHLTVICCCIMCMPSWHRLSYQQAVACWPCVFQLQVLAASASALTLPVPLAHEVVIPAVLPVASPPPSQPP